VNKQRSCVRCPHSARCLVSNGGPCIHFCAMCGDVKIAFDLRNKMDYWDNTYQLRAPAGCPRVKESADYEARHITADLNNDTARGWFTRVRTPFLSFYVCPSERCQEGLKALEEKQRAEFKKKLPRGKNARRARRGREERAHAPVQKT